MTTYIKVSVAGSKNTPETLCQAFRHKFTPGGTGSWQGLTLTADSEKADFFIDLGGGPQDPHKTRQNTIYVQREPHAPLRHVKKKYQHVIFYQQYYHVAVWRIYYSFDELLALKTPPKPKKISSVTSGKSSGGRSKRLKFLLELGSRTALDVWGNFAPPNAPFNKMGYTQFKQGGLLDYEFSVATEHMLVPGYFSEKFIDPLLCWCKVIYYGCPDIAGYFPQGSYFWASPENPLVYEEVVEELQRPVDLEAIREARHLILNKYSLIPTLAGYIQTL